MLKSMSVRATLAAIACALSMSAHAMADTAKKVEIPAGALRPALLRLSKVFDIELFYEPGPLKDLRTAGVKGTYTSHDAIQILLKGTPLELRTDPSGAMLIMPVAATVRSADQAQPPPGTSQDSTKEAGKTASQDFPVAQVDQAPAGPQVAQKKAETKQQPVELEEIVVTGTYLHDVEPLTPVTTITAEYMIEQGYSRLDDALQNLPQNFKGGVAQDQNGILAVGPGVSNNYSFSSGVNLHALGGDATLVLLNGRRLAPTAFGYSVDISQVPVSVIDRVEIMADGASAIYGSDAIAGVVNIITKPSFTGLDVGARSTGIADRKVPNYGGYVTGGESWGSGNIVGNFDFEKDNALFARDRPFTDTLPDPTVLLPKQETDSAYIGLHQSFSDDLKLSSDVLASRRDYEAETALFGLQVLTGHAEQVAISTELDYLPSSKWTLALIGAFSRERDLSLDVPVPYRENLTYDTPSLEGRADGVVLSLPAGEVHAAVGGSVRSETFEDSLQYSSGYVTRTSRHIGSAYGEVLVPILSDMPLVKALRIDVAERYDHYSDFGGTSNSKVALQWMIFDPLKVHASYGTSFKAPTLYELDLIEGYYLYDYPVSDPKAPGGTAPALILDGNNPNLLPERAKTFNLGATYTPLRGLSAEVSYFHVDYTNKIERLSDNGFLGNIITEATQLGSLVNLNPTIQQINSLLNSGRQVVNYINGFCIEPSPGCTVDPSTIKAIGNVGYNNVGSSVVDGIDSSVRFSLDSAYGRFDLDAAESYFLHFKNKITPASAQYSAVNIIYNPVRLRANIGAGWSRGIFAAHARINFENSYFDNTNFETFSLNNGVTTCPGRGCPIGSWTTVDAGVALNVPASSSSIWQGLRLGLDVTDLLNRGPPFALSGIQTGLNYDPTNASPLGRALSLRVSKRFGGASQ